MKSNVKQVKAKNKTIILKDGVERELIFDLNAMAELEDMYGTVDAAFKKLDEGSVKAVRAVLWAGLLATEPDITIQKVGSLIDLAYLTELMQTMEEAIKQDMPIDEVETAEGESPNT